MEILEPFRPFGAGNLLLSNHQKLAEANRRRVLGLIGRKNCLSQKDLARRTTLQPSTVSNIVRSLKTAGMVKDGEAIAVGRVGPRETILEINPEYGWSAGLSLDVHHRLIVLDATGLPIYQADYPAGSTVPDVLRTLPARLADIRRKHRLSPERFAGVGVSVAGVVNAARGMVLLSRVLHEELLPLQAEIEAALHQPVRVERDVVCGAYAERAAGVAREIDSFLYLTINRHGQDQRGFGLAAVAEENILRGTHSAAGEIDYLMERLLSLSPTAADPQDVEQFYRNYGEALAVIVNLLDIDFLIVSANDEVLTDARLRSLEATMSAKLVSVPGRKVCLHRSGLQVDGPLIGAGLLALHHKMARDLASTNLPPTLAPARGRRGVRATA